MGTTGVALNLVGGAKRLIRIALSYMSPPSLTKVVAWACFLLFPPFLAAFLWCLKDEWGKPNFLTGGHK